MTTPSVGGPERGGGVWLLRRTVGNLRIVVPYEFVVGLMIVY